jgi:hypothetical protein
MSHQQKDSKKSSTSMKDGMMNVLGLATNVGGRVADVAICAPVAPTNTGTNPSDEEVGVNKTKYTNCFFLT